MRKEEWSEEEDGEAAGWVEAKPQWIQAEVPLEAVPLYSSEDLKGFLYLAFMAASLLLILVPASFILPEIKSCLCC